ncbi:MAG TPA: amidohydrolase, partial [Candidatus Izemoplasmatales bacterium]|nr:amidohydrolase [Candidatus Izemoplasmatales bacterium]
MSLKDYVIEQRRYLHQHPETGFHCKNTSQYIEEELKRMPITKIEHAGKHSLIATVENGKGMTMGLRADFDALNILEDTNLPFASKNIGKMHACGHDAHTAMLLGAVKYLSSHKDIWQGTIKFIFQEAEEGPAPGGALAIVKSGLLNDCDDFYALHVSPHYPTGVLAINYGPAMAAADTIHLTLNGKGAHAALPEEGIDPIIMQAEYILGAQSIITRKISPMERAVITIAKVQAGTTHNVIPEKAKLMGTVRTFNQEVRETIKAELALLAQMITKRHGGNYQFDYEYGYDPVINTEDSVNSLICSAKKVLGQDQIRILDLPMAGGEDFSRYINLKQGALAWLGVQQTDQKTYNIHHPKFNLNEDALIHGTNIFIELV